MTCVTCCVHCNKVSAHNRACGEPRDCTTDHSIRPIPVTTQSLSLFLSLSTLGVIVCVGGWLVYLVHCLGGGVVVWLAWLLIRCPQCAVVIMEHGAIGAWLSLLRLRSWLRFYCLCYFIVKISSEQQGSLSILLYCTVVVHAIKTMV